MKLDRVFHLKTKTDHTAKGQTFIILAVAFLVLVAFVGLATDAGLAFIAYGRLSRAADAAALSAAAQFREGRSVSEMRATAENAMAVNGVDFTAIDVEICDYSLPEDEQDPQICPQPERKKLVRITVSADVPCLLQKQPRWTSCW
jgi:Flp pilus assembly protein TadG